MVEHTLLPHAGYMYFTTSCSIHTLQPHAGSYILLTWDVALSPFSAFRLSQAEISGASLDSLCGTFQRQSDPP